MFSEKISSLTFVTTNDSALIFIVIEVITFMKCKYRDLVRLTLAFPHPLELRLALHLLLPSS